MSTAITAETTAAERRDALFGRLFHANLDLLEVFSVYLGDRLELYRAIANAGEVTSSEVAARAGTDERYTREWLEQQAVAGFLACGNPEAAPGARRFHLPAGHEDVLLDRLSPSYLTFLARFNASVGQALPWLISAFRSGHGVPWEAFGPDAREGQADQNRVVFTETLGKEWLPSIPDLHARLLADPAARVADVGCGGGWSSIGIAQAYPNVHVDGFDLDEPSLVLARENAAEARVADRVRFLHKDAAEADGAGTYQLVIALECIHDMSNPVAVLRAMRRLVAPNGAVLVVDERVAEEFAAPGDELERLFYCFSVLCCLPVGRADTPSAATGTVMRPSTLRRYAQEAGFDDIKVLPIEHDFFRVYRLVG